MLRPCAAFGVTFKEDAWDIRGADVPELPGCMADGTTATEALENAEQVIREWIETAEMLGREIPQPKGRLVYA